MENVADKEVLLAGRSQTLWPKPTARLLGKKPRKYNLLARQKMAYGAYKRRAMAKNHSFDLTLDQFIVFWGRQCRYCQVPIRTVGLDRLDNAKGYEIENVTPCCPKCNVAKNRWSLREYVSRCRQVTKTFRGCTTMEEMENIVKQQHLADGTKTRAFFVKHLAIEDYEALQALKAQFSIPTDAAALRFMIRKVGNQI